MSLSAKTLSLNLWYNINTDKAPGLDGFSAAFFQKN